MRFLSFLITFYFFLSAMSSCNEPQAQPWEKTSISPGDNDQKTVQTALINAQPGDTLFFEEGFFNFTAGISMEGIDSVTLKGRGHDKTIFSFKNQTEGAEGVKIQGNFFTIEDIGIEDTKGDGLKISHSDGVIIRRVRMEWTRGADSSNGSYGLYSVSCKNVLMEDCIAKAASDAGIYVGQSEYAVVRRNIVEGNVAGIEVENTDHAEVYENIARNNTAGIMIFDLPDLPKKNGKYVKIYNNEIIDNNHPNFSKRGLAVYMVPSGTGLLLMACQQVEAFNNMIINNSTIGTAIIKLIGDQEIMERQSRDSLFDVYPSGIYLHDNIYERKDMIPDTTKPFGNLLFKAFGSNTPSIIFDGELNPEFAVEGKLHGSHRICIQNNRKASFMNLATGSPDKTAHECNLPTFPPVILPMKKKQTSSLN